MSENRNQCIKTNKHLINTREENPELVPQVFQPAADQTWWCVTGGRRGPPQGSTGGGGIWEDCGLWPLVQHSLEDCHSPLKKKTKLKSLICCSVMHGSRSLFKNELFQETRMFILYKACVHAVLLFLAEVADRLRCNAWVWEMSNAMTESPSLG